LEPILLNAGNDNEDGMGFKAGRTVYIKALKVAKDRRASDIKVPQDRKTQN
jgi:hypothetical protein